MNTIDLTDVAGLIARCEKSPTRTVQLEPGEPFYAEPRDEWIRPESDFTPSVVEQLTRELASESADVHYFAEFYDLNGRRIPKDERGDDWHAAHPEPPGAGAWNTAAKLGDDVLMIGRGAFIVTDPARLDGEPGFRFVTDSKYTADAIREFRDKQDMQRRVLPAIESARPTWATSYDLDPEDGGAVVVTYGAEVVVGQVTVTATQVAIHESGTVGGFEPVHFHLTPDEGLTMDNLRDLTSAAVVMLGRFEDA